MGGEMGGGMEEEAEKGEEQGEGGKAVKTVYIDSRVSSSVLGVIKILLFSFLYKGSSRFVVFVSVVRRHLSRPRQIGITRRHIFTAFITHMQPASASPTYINAPETAS